MGLSYQNIIENNSNKRMMFVFKFIWIGNRYYCKCFFVIQGNMELLLVPDCTYDGKYLFKIVNNSLCMLQKQFILFNMVRICSYMDMDNVIRTLGVNTRSKLLLKVNVNHPASKQGPCCRSLD